MSARSFRIAADATLGATLFVILWGAFVRATGSGAGCGSHWPTCQGQVVPRAASTEMLIEYTHRATSGVVLLLVVGLVVVARRALPRGHVGRASAVASLLFMLLEAAIGAGLVLFEKVADDASLARGAWMSAHLVNTLLLLAALGVTSWAARAATPPSWAPAPRAIGLLGSALLALLFVGVTGAVAALGDTLFPAATLAEGLAADLHREAHPFVRLRALHPFVAAVCALYLLVVGMVFSRSESARTRRLASRVGGLTVLQVVVGLVNLVLAAPTAMQLVHLLVADALWLALVWLGAEAVSTPAEAPPARAALAPDQAHSL